MKLVNDEKTIRAIAAMLLDMQERENTNLPLLTEQLKETQRGIDNLLNAIQQGIFTKSTKGRLEELEAAKEELEIKIANEKIAKRGAVCLCAGASVRGTGYLRGRLCERQLVRTL